MFDTTNEVETTTATNEHVARDEAGLRELERELFEEEFDRFYEEYVDQPVQTYPTEPVR
jgi:hypothetical protein